MEAPTERWKPIPGYEGLYEVSDWGRVRSLDRYMAPSVGTTERLHRGRLLRPSRKPTGHLKVNLQVDRVSHYPRVHQLVLQAFVGPCPPGMEGCHGDGDPANNSLSNLRWDTKKSNAADMVKHGRAGRGGFKRGECHLAKLSPDQVRAIRELGAGFLTHREIAAQFEVSRPTVDGILSGKKYTHVAVI